MQVFILTAVLATLANAWSINGHYMVANIAKNYLHDHNKSTHDKVEKMLMYLWDAHQDVIPYEKTHHFVESATFADDIKYTHDGHWNADYHFIDIPNIAEGKESDYDISDEPKNLTYAIPNLVSWLSGKGGDSYLKSDIYV